MCAAYASFDDCHDSTALGRPFMRWDEAQLPFRPASSPADLHVSIALGVGIAMLPLLAPEALGLPYDVVTIPVAEHLPAT